MKRKALGKGLRSLIPEAPRRTPPEAATAGPDGSAVRHGYPLIDIDRIVPNRQQPRDHFDEAGLEALAGSLKAQGVLQPVLVRPLEDGTYGLVAGERRWRAAQRAGLLKIPALVKDVPDDRLLEMALIENIQREDLNPIDEARAYRTLVDELGLTQQEVSERVGKQRATIANSIRLLSLSEGVQKLLRSRELSMGHARALVALDSTSDQLALAERAVREGLSVREVEAQVAKLQRTKVAITMSMPRSIQRRDPNVVAAEETLQRTLGTKVRIFHGKKGAGRLELHFFSADELDRLYQVLLLSGRNVG